MKRIKSLNNFIIFTLIFSCGSSFAFEVGGTRNECRPPKFRSFSPPERVKKGPISEVEAESEISFTVSATANPESIIVKVRKKEIERTVENKHSYFQVTAKLPAEFNGKFARIDIWAKDKERNCKSKDGWLIKIKDAVEKVVEETAVEEAAVAEPTAETNE